MIAKNKKVMITSIILVIGFVLWTIFPILMIAQQSIKPRLLMFNDPPALFFSPTMDHFTNIFTRQDILSFVKNSLVIAVFSTMACLLLGSLAAYALSSLKVPGGNAWALVILAARMIPTGTLMIPVYVIMRNLGFINTYLAVIIVHTALNLPFAIWMMRSFFDDVPPVLQQAAMVDGCSRFATFCRIALPLAAPGLVATGILTMLNSWNEFMFALILTGRNTRTLPVGISSFIGSISIDWGASSAAAIVSSVPIFIAGILIQKYLIRGMTMGAVKG